MDLGWTRWTRVKLGGQDGQAPNWGTDRKGQAWALRGARLAAMLALSHTIVAARSPIRPQSTMVGCSGACPSPCLTSVTDARLLPWALPKKTLLRQVCSSDVQRPHFRSLRQ